MTRLVAASISSSYLPTAAAAMPSVESWQRIHPLLVLYSPACRSFAECILLGFPSFPYTTQWLCSSLRRLYFFYQMRQPSSFHDGSVTNYRKSFAVLRKVKSTVIESILWEFRKSNLVSMIDDPRVKLLETLLSSHALL